MFQSSSAGHAKAYFAASLSKADYYIKDQEHPGYFHGKIAERLGIEGAEVTADIFNQLCENINPDTLENLTPRTIEHRRVGYDISFHCPKSVSILHALGKDDRVLHAFKEAVYKTMRDMEQDMQTRVRVQGQDHDRDTGEMLWTDFVHETARPVKGHAPDPHLHCHCFTFNVTYDHSEQRFKAGQFHNIKLDMPYYQARFQKRLADRLSQHGYGIRKTQNGFEVSVIPQKAIDYFSKRTDQIGRIAKEFQITDPKELDGLGARTRAKKDSHLTMKELRRTWRSDLKAAGLDARLEGEQPTIKKDLSVQTCVDHTLDHAYTRSSVKRLRQLQATAYSHAIDDRSVSMDQIDQVFDQDQRLFTIKDGKQILCTTALVYDEERQMVTTALHGRGKLRPLVGRDYKFKADHLDQGQQKAVQHILKSTDKITMIRGGAGTGKTTLIKSAVAEIERTGKSVFLFAPTANASRHVLKEEGFKQADTVASLIKNTAHHDQIRNQVIWIDEAGMLGTKDMKQVQDIANNLKARLILSGDPRQHSAVDR
ncbi:MAG: MobF family relaxase, partial [Cyclobacteriaceae bacterium]